MKSPVLSSNFGLRTETDKVFDNLVPVQIQTQSNEERKQFIRLSVELIPVGLSSSSFRKDFHVEITDEQDPYLFYSLRMSEEDFSILKSQQGLLIDFSSFPSKFVQLVERCVLEQQSEIPKFLIILKHYNEMSKPCYLLEIVETNPFKHLCHLSLRMSEGSEGQIKKHLSNKLRQFKEERDEHMQFIQSIEQQLDLERKNSAQKTAELNLLKNDFQTKLQETQHQLKIEFQTEKNLLQQTKSELEQQLKVQQLQTNEKENCLQYQIKELRDKHFNIDTNLKETTTRLNKAEEECSRLQQELTSARRRSASLDADFHTKERAVHQLRTKLAVGEQELRDKDILLAKQQDLQTSAQEQKKRLTEMIDEKDQVISRRECAVKTMTEELIKANDIIRKLQGDIRSLNIKLKTRTDVATEQEKFLRQNENDISELQEQLKNYTKINEEATELKIKNEEKEMAIKSKEQIITYLNKQLNELQLRPEKTANSPWFSTPNEGPNASPKIPMSTLRPSPLQLGQSTDNRENDEPLDPKYFQPKSYGGLVRKEKSTEKHVANHKPSSYFKK